MSGFQIITRQLLDTTDEHELTYLRDVFRQYAGRTIRIQIKTADLFSGEEILFDSVETIEPIKGGFSSWWNSFTRRALFIDSQEFIFDKYPNARLIIAVQKKVTPMKYKQFFLDGPSHCVFQPMINKCNEKSINAESKTTHYKYKALAKKIERYPSIYPNGVQESDLQNICDDLQIAINIDTPSSVVDKKTSFIKFRSQKKPLLVFNFINTRIDHVELNEVVNKDNYIEISQSELNKIVDDKINQDEFVLFKGNLGRIQQVNCLENIYILNKSEGYSKVVLEFRKLNKLDECKVEYFSNKLLSKFLQININTNLALTFNPYRYTDKQEYFDEYIEKIDKGELEYLQSELNKDNTPLYQKEILDRITVLNFINSQDINHIDMKKAYTRGPDCDFYQGYLGKITDFRKTNKIMGIGIYLIYNIRNIPENIQKLGVLYENNAYPSPELAYYKSLGIQFDIYLGCWGSNIDINFTEDMFKKDEFGVKHYCRWYGCLQILKKKEYYNFSCKNIEFAQLNKSSNDNSDIRYNSNTKLGIIEYKKEKAYHSTHIACFIHSYCRISMIQQILKFKDFNQIIAVQVDGIYYKGQVEILPLFSSDKEGKGIKYCNGSNYIDEVFNRKEDYANLPENRENNLIEVHTGPGGAGKTHLNLIDKGFISPMYIAPSWKVARDKQKEYNIDSSVFHYLLSDDPTMFLPILNNANTLIIDEVSMMENKDKNKIIRRYKNHKIIFCGDLGYQLPPFNEVQKIKDYKIVEFKIGDLKHIKHTTNYRCKCNKLKKLLVEIRNLIDLKNILIPDSLYQKLTIIDKDTIDYKIDDLIIASTNKIKDEYTEKYKYLNKYYITENTRDYSNGEIIIGEKPENCNSEIRHGFTIHSVQGITVNHKLFIDMRCVTKLRTLYTAVSRARRFEQIVFIK